MALYSVDKLILEARNLAKNYHSLTGHSLPVSAELAKYDFDKLALLKLKSSIIEPNPRFLIKAKVLFKPRFDTRIGTLNLKSSWSHVALVLYLFDYNPVEMYIASRNTLIENISGKDKSLSIAKFKKLGHLIWPSSMTPA